MKTLNLLSGAMLVVYSSLSIAQNCPDGFTEQISIANATVSEENGHDHQRIEGIPDQEFAKLDKSSEYFILELDETLKAGLTLKLYIASYDNKLSSGTVEGSTDGNNFFGAQQFTTGIKKPDSEVKSFTFVNDVNFIKLSHNHHKILFDAVESQFLVCKPSPIPDKDVISCLDNEKNICFTADLPDDGYYNYNLHVISEASNGVFTSDEFPNDDLCKLGDPAQLTFAYQAGSCDDEQNDQQGNQCNGSIQGTGDVYIRVSNKDNAADISAEVYFEGIVSIYDAFTAKASNAGKDKFPRDLKIHILSSDQNSVLQFIKIKTDCGRDHDIFIGNSFGALTVVGYESKYGDKISLEPECALASSYVPNSGFSGLDVIQIEISAKNRSDHKDTVDINIHVLDSNNSECKQIGNSLEFPLCPNTPKTICLDDIFEVDDIEFTLLLNSNEIDGTFDLGSLNGSNTDCCDVNGDPESLTFVYTPESVDNHSQPESKGYVLTNGSTNGEEVYVVANNSQLDTNGTIYYKGMVDILETFEMTSSSFSSNSYVHILDSDSKEEIQLINIHTSCSAPIVIGDRYGYMMLIGSGNDNGSCGGTNTIESCCDVIGKPDKITFEYTNSNVVNNSQPDGKSSVTDYSTPDYGTVYIIANDQVSGTGGNIYFSGKVTLNSQFQIDDQGDQFESNTYLHIYDESQTTLIQRVQFHTSCSAPIIPGEQFGLLVLNGIENADGICGSSSNCENIVTYYPSQNYTGRDTAEVMTCILDPNSSKLDCDTILLQFIVNSTPPVAASDRFLKIQLEENPNSYQGTFDILANDYHQFNAPFILKKELIKEPSLNNAVAYINQDDKLFYSIQNLENNNMDTVMYKLSTDCSCDTGIVEIGFEVLPVTWLSFDATLEDGPTVYLNWKTASEIDNEGFYIERSFNGHDFQEIGYVEGNGTVQTMSEYAFIDYEPGSKINYYRLRQQDFDGQFEYSETRVVSLSEISQVKIIPNPNNGKFLVEWNAIREGMNIGIELVDMSGVVLYQGQSASESSAVSDIPQGVYILRLTSPNGSVTTKRVLIL